MSDSPISVDAGADRGPGSSSGGLEPGPPSHSSSDEVRNAYKIGSLSATVGKYQAEHKAFLSALEALTKRVAALEEEKEKLAGLIEKYKPIADKAKFLLRVS